MFESCRAHPYAPHLICINGPSGKRHLARLDGADDTGAMSWWRRNLVLIVAAAFLLLGTLSYVLFNTGGSRPGRGTGDAVTGRSGP